MSTAQLVRNKVPDILRSNGVIPITYQAGAVERRLRLRANLRRYVGTFLATDPDILGVDELADITEVIRALCSAHNITLKDLERARSAKADSHGTFSDGTVWTGNK